MMDERAVRAAAERIKREAHGLFMGTGEACSMVPYTAIEALVEAIDAEPAPPVEAVVEALVNEPAPARPAPASMWPDPDARPTY